MLELAVAVELVAEEIAEADRPRLNAPDHLRQRRLVHLEQRELGSAGREQGGGHAGDEVRAGAVVREAEARRRGSAAAIAAVVVLPFVAEITAAPAGSRAASRSIAPGSSFERSFPGTVVPPPAPASRDSAATPRAAAISAASGTRSCTARGYATGDVPRLSELARNNEGPDPSGGGPSPVSALGSISVTCSAASAHTCAET